MLALLYDFTHIGIRPPLLVMAQKFKSVPNDIRVKLMVKNGSKSQRNIPNTKASDTKKIIALKVCRAILDTDIPQHYKYK